MPLHRLFRDEEARIAIWKIEETAEGLLALMPPGLQERYGKESRKRFNPASRQEEWLAVRAIAHSVFGLPRPIAYKPTGLPFIRDTRIYASISHCRGFAAMAISERPVGIDLELIGKRALRTKGRFLTHEEELAVFRTSGPSEEEFTATAAWTAKEAAFKFFAHESPLQVVCETSITGFDATGCRLETNKGPKRTCGARFHVFGELLCTSAR